MTQRKRKLAGVSWIILKISGVQYIVTIRITEVSTYISELSMNNGPDGATIVEYV